MAGLIPDVHLNSVTGKGVSVEVMILEELMLRIFFWYQLCDIVACTGMGR